MPGGAGRARRPAGSRGAATRHSRAGHGQGAPRHEIARARRSPFGGAARPIDRPRGARSRPNASGWRRASSTPPARPAAPSESQSSAPYSPAATATSRWTPHSSPPRASTPAASRWRSEDGAELAASSASARERRTLGRESLGTARIPRLSTDVVQLVVRTDERRASSRPSDHLHDREASPRRSSPSRARVSSPRSGPRRRSRPSRRSVSSDHGHVVPGTA